MRNPDPHDGCGARRRRACRSTSTTPRVLTDAAARAACRRPCPGSAPARARGFRATRGPRPPPQEHSRTATDRRPPSCPTRRDRDGFERAAPPCTTGFSLNPTPNTATPMTTKENPCATTAEPPPTPTATPSPSSGAASRRSSSERAATGFTVVLPGDEPLEFRVFLCKDADEAAACLQRHWRGKRAGPGDEARRPAPGVPARPATRPSGARTASASGAALPEAGDPAVRASRPGGRPPADGTHRFPSTPQPTAGAGCGVFLLNRRRCVVRPRRLRGGAAPGGCGLCGRTRILAGPVRVSR